MKKTKVCTRAVRRRSQTPLSPVATTSASPRSHTAACWTHLALGLQPRRREQNWCTRARVTWAFRTTSLWPSQNVPSFGKQLHSSLYPYRDARDRPTTFSITDTVILLTLFIDKSVFKILLRFYACAHLSDLAGILSLSILLLDEPEK